MLKHLIVPLLLLTSLAFEVCAQDQAFNYNFSDVPHRALHSRCLPGATYTGLLSLRGTTSGASGRNYLTKIGGSACAVDFPFAGSRVKRVTEPLLADSIADCRGRLLRGGRLASSRATARAGYDSLKAMLSDCRNTDYASTSFGDMSAALDLIGDNEMWYTHRQYLIQVYPWNGTETYRCAVLSSIAETFDRYGARDAKGNYYTDFNGYVAVVDYILQHHVCSNSGNDTSWWESRTSERQRQRDVWADTVKDSLKTPLDTAAVSLQDIGLGFLLSAPARSGSGAQAIKTFYVVGNPFDGEPAIRYSLEGADLAQIEVFDVLGNRVWISDRSLVGTDEREVKIPLATAGKYFYIGLSTAGGAVRTLRIVRK